MHLAVLEKGIFLLFKFKFKLFFCLWVSYFRYILRKKDSAKTVKTILLYLIYYPPTIELLLSGYLICYFRRFSIH